MNTAKAFAYRQVSETKNLATENSESGPGEERPHGWNPRWGTPLTDAGSRVLNKPLTDLRAVAPPRAFIRDEILT
jgi:hypothetical protein